MSPEYENLIDSLLKDGYLKTPHIIEAFKAIDRVDFVLEEHKNDAYVNAPLPIGFGQTISQPLTVAFMLELLEPKAGDKILDIGAGSGWTASLLAFIVSREGNPKSEILNPKQTLNSKSQNYKIVAIECIPELQTMAQKNISKYSFIEKGVVKIACADGSKGYPLEAPYDKIIVAAAAKGNIPAAWRKQLKIGGRIVAPVENSIVIIDKVGKNKYNEREHFGFSFVPLVSKPK